MRNMPHGFIYPGHCGWRQRVSDQASHFSVIRASDANKELQSPLRSPRVADENAQAHELRSKPLGKG
jgi:hypothetical protein